MIEKRVRPRSQQMPLRRRTLLLGAAGATTWLVACDDPKEDRPAATGTEPPAAGSSGRPDGGQAASPAGPRRGGVWRVTAPQGIDSVDVHRALSDATTRLAGQTQSKLFRHAEPDAGTLEGDLVERHETPDAATYTFTLRQGVKWQNIAPANGRELVAEDIVWHIERQRAEKLASGERAPMRHHALHAAISRVEAPDARTVRLTLDAPNGAFLDQLAAPSATVPNREATERFEGSHRTLAAAALLGTGPFILKEVRADGDLALARNPDYFRQGEPLLDGQLWTGRYANPFDQWTAFAGKSVDRFVAPNPSVVQTLLKANSGAAYEIRAPARTPVFLHLNTGRQFKDARLVMAANRAIDRAELIKALHGGLGRASGPVPWFKERYAIPQDQLADYPGYGPDRAKETREGRQLWQAGGGASLGEVEIVVPEAWLAHWPDTPKILARMLDDGLGVSQFRVTPVDFGREVVPKLFAGDFPNWFGWAWTTEASDPRLDLRNAFLSGSAANFNGVKDARLDTHLQEALATPDADRARTALQAAQTLLLENAQYGSIVLYNYVSTSAAWDYFRPPLRSQPTTGTAAVGYALDAEHLVAGRGWLDSAAASFGGRPPAEL